MAFIDRPEEEQIFISIMNGLTLTNAVRIYGNGKKSAYGRIRVKFLKNCEARNPEKYEELRIKDASRKSNFKNNTSADVGYETLQLSRHDFLTEDEINEYRSYITGLAGVEDCDLNALIAKRAKYDGALSVQVAVLRSTGYVTESNIDALEKIVLPMVEVMDDVEKQLRVARLIDSLSSIAIRFQTLDRIAAFEQRRK